ncbi:DUF2971 domain-containing protein [Gordonia westfalica]|uniref:DUF2971 domain-containing protein n=1 Tax=Gordonia westfalica TaxID=158898 RepID=A0ABU2GV35_9ACTN|nr:DUF2971 domain-containing protein [Gordonia westfalica]MDS1115329.1 DUF2971 domain-containing protein [Gordonia westfalica]
MDDSSFSDEIVYHYTSPAGLLGIVDSPMDRIGGVPDWMLNRGQLVVLHASDVRYMNDSRELRVAGDLVAERLKERIDELDPTVEPEARAAVEAAVAAIDSQDMPFGGSHRVFAVCFCSDGDLLSQWRGYAGSQGGYAIGFRRKVLQITNIGKVGEWSSFSALARPAATLMKVEYERHGELTDSFVGSIISQAKSRVGVAYAFPPLWGQMSRFAKYKDPSFREEQEWRLVFESAPTREPSIPVLFRSRADGIVPYIPIVVGTPPTYAPNPHNLNFDEVIADLVVGPGPDMKLRVDAAKALLYRTGHNPDVVRESAVPFKG